MLRTLALIAALFPLAACGEQAGTEPGESRAEAIDPFNLHIEIGRYGAMLSTVEGLTAETPSAAAEEDVTAPANLARHLRQNVWEYNLLRSRLCARGLFTQQSCGPSYNPVWLADPADAAVSLEEIQARNQAFGEEVSPLWGAVCDAARQGVPEDEQMAVCPME